MKINKSTNLSLDQFINLALYDKNSGYYMKQNPFGEEGDFITAPEISQIFGELIGLAFVDYWYQCNNCLLYTSDAADE